MAARRISSARFMQMRYAGKAVIAGRRSITVSKDLLRCNLHRVGRKALKIDIPPRIRMRFQLRCKTATILEWEFINYWEIGSITACV